ncbi:MAG: helix-turn-helix transcriptional regulator [Lachnospiraceae bacterium]|nr:helix-turn-helix transcriptional regulator [Lachnospiraceae bacterium]
MINKLKELRVAQGLTQKQVGEKVGVSRQAINAIETGKFEPSIWLAYDLSRLFEMSIEDLFDFERSERR